MRLDVVQHSPPGLQYGLQGRHLGLEGVPQFLNGKIQAPAPEMGAVGIRRVRPDPDPMPHCQGRYLLHAFSISGMPATGNIARTNQGQQFCFISDPFPGIAIDIDLPGFCNQGFHKPRMVLKASPLTSNSTPPASRSCHPLFR